MQSEIEVSVLIVNWNGARLLPTCLQALAAQTFRNFEVVLVDNASSDGSVDGIETAFQEVARQVDGCAPELRLFRLEQNLGFAAGNNFGARQARGRWLFLLNNDAYLDPACLAALMQAVQEEPAYTCFATQMLQVNQPDVLDGAGLVYHASGLAWSRGHNQSASVVKIEDPGASPYGAYASRMPVFGASPYGAYASRMPVFGASPHGAYASRMPVFGACAAAALYRLDAFRQVGGFDEQFQNYYEDVDLAFRLLLAGFRCLYVPQAIVLHVGSASFGSQSDRSVYFQQRNWIWTYWKDLPASLFWRFLPAHGLAGLVFMFYYLRRGQGRVFFKAKFDALSGLPAIWHSRRQVQRARRTSARQILALVDRSAFGPYTLGKYARNKRRAG